MSAIFGRQPPRFVPTLTEVVAEQPIARAISPADEALARELLAAEVVGNQNSVASVSSTETQQLEVKGVQDLVMARLDTMLPERMRDAINEAIESQVNAIYTTMRPGIEAVVRQAINEAVTHQLAHKELIQHHG